MSDILPCVCVSGEFFNVFLRMDLSFNVLESIRRDIRELRDDLSSEKSTRSRQIDELTQDVKDIRRHVARDCCALEATIRSPLMLDR